MTSPPRPTRVLLKLSGEALSGEREHGIDPTTLRAIGEEIASVVALDVQLAVVVGGGNFFRGMQAAAAGFERASADYMGMLATIMNALALEQQLRSLQVAARVQSAIPVSPVSEPYVRHRAIKHLQAGRVVIFAGGTGNPFFTTDTAASLRAVEIGAGLLLKATQVDGVYDADPQQHADARRYSSVTYNEVLERRLGVMDATAIALCREHNMPLRVFAIRETGTLARIVQGSDEGTLVASEV